MLQSSPRYYREKSILAGEGSIRSSIPDTARKSSLSPLKLDERKLSHVSSGCALSTDGRGCELMNQRILDLALKRKIEARRKEREDRIEEV